MNDISHICYTLSRHSNRCDACGALLPTTTDMLEELSALKARINILESQMSGLLVQTCDESEVDNNEHNRTN